MGTPESPPDDEAIDRLLDELDDIARDFDEDDFGLPLGSVPIRDRLRAAVRRWAAGAAAPAGFGCAIIVLIHAADGISVGTQRRRLPFAPTAGLRLTGIRIPDPPDVDEGEPIRDLCWVDEGEPIRDVCWVAEEARFIVTLDDDEDPAADGATLAEAKTLYRDFTWQDVRRC